MDSHSYYPFLQNLLLVLGAAAVSTLIFHKLKQPIILGYLLAGMIIGPHTSIPVFADPNIIHTLSELGVILLMFSLGLEFSIRKLIKVFPSAGLIAILQCSFMVWIGYLTGQLFEWSRLESIYAGAIIAISSTTIIIKAFSEQKIQGKLTEIVYAVLIVEDLVAILLLAILTPLSKGAHLSSGKMIEIIGTLSAFLIGLLSIGLLIVPRFIRWVIQLRRPEITIVVNIGFCFAIALLAKKCGYSVALGAFLAGSLIAESGEGESIAHSIQPLCDIFGAVFFVSVGMLIDLSLLPHYWFPILIFTLLVVFGKIIGVSLGAFLTGYPPRLSIKTGMSLAQIGEFSFIIASVGLATGATRSFLYPIAVMVSALTTLITPWLIRASSPVANYIDRHLPQSLETFTSLYGSWIQKLKQNQANKTSQKPLRRLLKVLLIDSILLIILVISASLFRKKIIYFVFSFLPLPILFLNILLVFVLSLLSSPFFIGIIRSSKRLGLLLATSVIPTVDQETVDLANAPRRALIVTLQLLIILVIGSVLLTIIQPFLPILYSVLLFGAGLIFLVISFFRSTENLQGHLKAGAQVILETLTPKHQLSKKTNNVSLEKILPGIGNIFSIQLGRENQVIGKTLAEIDLRGLTGATVVAITHEGKEGVVIPTGKEMLQPNDTLALIGSPKALEASKKLLS